PLAGFRRRRDVGIKFTSDPRSGAVSEGIFEEGRGLFAPLSYLDDYRIGPLRCSSRCYERSDEKRCIACVREGVGRQRRGRPAQRAAGSHERRPIRRLIVVGVERALSGKAVEIRTLRLTRDGPEAK